MGGSMPYQLEKGPYFAVTESVLEDQEMRVDVLARLRSGEGFDSMPSLGTASLDAGPWTDFATRLAHQNEDWYGKRFNKRTKKWEKQPGFDVVKNPTTGYWYSWYGDAEEIMRVVFTRAIEVSLGIPHEPSVTDASKIYPARSWPIEVFWRCPAPWFEGWVTWREHHQQQCCGHVTVHLHTPSHHDSALLLSPIRSAPQSTRADYLPDYGQHTVPPEPPAPPLRSSGYGDRGMWVIAHREQREHPSYGPTSGTLGSWDLPSFGPVVESRGDIVVVQPNEPDGGVVAGGRSFA
jgi:hypothetical protein